MSREAMQAAPRLKNGTIIPASAIRCINRFAAPEQRRWKVEHPWLPAEMVDLVTFESRDEALAAILAHDRSRS